MSDAAHNLVFQECVLPHANESARAEFLRKVPSQRKIDSFLRGQDRSNPSPRFGEFFDFQIAVFVAAVSDSDGTRVIVAGVTNVTQRQFERLAAFLGRGTLRWNRAEFISRVEELLGIAIKDPASDR